MARTALVAVALFGLLGVLIGFAQAQTCDPNNLKTFTLPSGFIVQPYHDGNVKFARSLAASGNNKLGGPIITYVSALGLFGGDLTSPQNVTALVDVLGRGVADYKVNIVPGALLGGATMPNGIAWFQNTLWIAALIQGVWGRLYRVDNIDAIALANRQATAAEVVLVRDDLPNAFMHGWKFIRFDKAGNLYIPIGADDNIALMNGTGTDGLLNSTATPHYSNAYQKNASTPIFRYSSIYKFGPYPITAATKPQWLAFGVRNTVGFDFQPSTGDLFFTDNGRDNIGGSNTTITSNAPDCELNYLGGVSGTYSAPRYFGYPYCHTTTSSNIQAQAPYLRPPGAGNDIVDPDTNLNEAAVQCNSPTKFHIKAVQALGPHIAPLGLRFGKSVSNGNFPSAYTSANTMFVAQHGSWNRPAGLIGARVMLVQLAEKGNSSYLSSVKTPFNIPVMDPKSVGVPRVSSYSSFLSGGVPGDTGLLPDGPSPPVIGSGSLFQGRPVDMEWLPDGSMIISDDQKGRVLRVAYCGTGSFPTDPQTAKLGMNRCGGVLSHTVTADKSSPKNSSRAATLANNGCAVNVAGLGLGMDTKTYTRCREVDVTGLGNYVTFAYNIAQSPVSGQVILDVALVTYDYASTNGKGWVALATNKLSRAGSSLVDGMVGLQAMVGKPAASATGAVINDLQLGNDNCQTPAVSCFTSTSGYLFNSTASTAGIVGGALVQSYNVIVSAANLDKNASAYIALGSTDEATGAMLQHWKIVPLRFILASSDVGASAANPSTLINPGLSWAAANAGGATPAPYPSAGSCSLNGQAYDTCTTVSDAGVPITFYSTSTSTDGVTLNAGLRAQIDSLGGSSKGWVAFAYNPTSPGSMLGTIAMFARYDASATSGATAAVFKLGSYATSGFVAPASNPFGSIQVWSEVFNGQTFLNAQFTLPWSSSVTPGGLLINYGAGPYNGGSATGADGMQQHIVVPPKACIRNTAGMGPISPCGGCA